jgi:hypothetical protein
MTGLTAFLTATVLLLAACASGDRPAAPATSAGAALAQAPGWSREDLDFFLHGSMSTDVIPERVLRAFVRTYPELFPRDDLSSFGLIPDPSFGWPVGFSRRPVPHLANLPSVGVNCASCHVADVVPASGGAPVRVLGATAHFDAEAFFGAVVIATFSTAEPASMQRFLDAYLVAGDAAAGDVARRRLSGAWEAQARQIAAAIAADPFGSQGIAPGALHAIGEEELRLDAAALEGGVDLVPVARGLLKLFHNIRAALHVPDQVPAGAPPAAGPGRNDAFGLLSAILLGVPQPPAPVKFGLAWNLADRRWVHWDGNTQSPIGRNVLAALGLGAPLEGKRARVDLALLERHTRLTEAIRAPRYPWAIDAAASARGAIVYGARCAACHEGAEGDARLHDPAAVGTDPTRAVAFTQAQADRFNRLLAELQMPGYTPSGTPGLRGTQRYWAPTLAGVWARSPYLHNGSVRTMAELLTPPAGRAASFQRGSRRYDAAALGYTDEGPYRLETRGPGRSNAGHAYGTDLSPADKRDLIEYLKTR